MTARQPFISYDPPHGGQPIRPKDALGAYEAVRRFLIHCTDWDGAETEGTLAVAEPGKYSPPEYRHQPVVEQATAFLGSGRRYEGITYLDSELAPIGAEYKHEWHVPSSAFQHGVALVAGLPRWPARYVPPVTLFTSYDVGVRDPRTGLSLGASGDAEAPHSLRSKIYLHLSSVPAAGFNLQFPFETAGAEFLEYIEAIRSYLPIKVAWNRFRRISPAVRGSGFVTRKISAGLFDGL